MLRTRRSDAHGTVGGMSSLGVLLQKETLFNKRRRKMEMLADGDFPFVILDYWRGTPK